MSVNQSRTFNIFVVMMKKTLFSLFLGLSCSLFVQAQTENDSIPEEPQVIQFSGVVVTGDSLSAVPHTSVYRESDRKGTFTDYYGFFSIPVMLGDTIAFSNMGYNESYYIIPDTLAENRYSVVQFIQQDTIQLPTTFIYPWPTPDKFKDEFLALTIPRTEQERAELALEKGLVYDKMVEMSNDGSQNYKIAMQQEADRLYYSGGQTPPINLFNPIAWAQFFKSWKNGDFKPQ